MLNPTPMLPPSPLDIGGLFQSSFRALKARFGLFVLLALLPSIVIIVVVASATLLMLPGILAASTGGPRALGVGLGVGIAVLVIGMFVAVLVQLKSYGMLSLAAYEIAQGQRPTVGGLWTRTKGFLPAMASVIAIAVGAVIAFYVVIGLMVVAATRMGSESGSGSASGFVFVLIVLLFLALFPLAIFLSTKLLYTVPAVALEHVGGIDGLKRSWSLTTGSFWRTFGYNFVASLAVSAASYAVSAVTQVALLPLSSLSGQTDGRRALAALAAMVPVLLLVFALQMAVQLVGLPFQQTYLTYMFVDQVRRSELPPVTYGAPQGYYAPPGQYYGQPGGTYGVPGQYPSPQGYPQQPPYPGQPGQQQGWTGQKQGWTGTNPQAPQQGQWPSQDNQGRTPPQG
ncbi:MAG: glycerophosphoryl diester phosphodiesterase membrane domain-containing protein [Propionicimonas sp.]|uniref:glycerophosphoryl diester phosphodiesterase membrane domain-containing protein n=1 Tax=Propionicimonas sp. TaxID=1955623 RepID=UPI003D141551